MRIVYKFLSGTKVSTKKIELFYGLSTRLSGFPIRICTSNINQNVFDIKNHHTKTNNTKTDTKLTKTQFEGPPLSYFLSVNHSPKPNPTLINFNHPYLSLEDVSGHSRKVYIETYGCQMNVNDTEIAWSILKSSGFIEEKDEKEADIILLMTCAIREGAEQTIWNRLEHLKALKIKKEKRDPERKVKIGLLGCMAERLKTKILEKDKLVDIVAGPDSYRDLPNLLSQAYSGQSAVNVQLSLEETYADVLPVRINPGSKSAFVSIMRGCDNMCSYCIVPFTRGRERSRPVYSIIEEINILSQQGIKEVTLLGQNVNSYRDTSKESYYFIETSNKEKTVPTAKGFKTIYKPKKGGLLFADLLENVSNIDPEMRIRFTSPHPKDFPDEVIDIIKERPNICKQIHLPAQSGSTQVLQRMRRGYTRESYKELVQRIRESIPDVALSSDFICGFCGETDEEHEETISLLKFVEYDFIYVFPYSMREKTHAYHKYKDEIPREVKIKRVNEISSLFREITLNKHKKLIGEEQLVLIEGNSKRSKQHWAARNDANTKVIFPKASIFDKQSNSKRDIQLGDYVVAKIEDCSSQVLKATALEHSSLQRYICNSYN